jgi:hypothetical protein
MQVYGLAWQSAEMTLVPIWRRRPDVQCFVEHVGRAFVALTTVRTTYVLSTRVLPPAGQRGSTSHTAVHAQERHTCAGMPLFFLPESHTCMHRY